MGFPPHPISAQMLFSAWLPSHHDLCRVEARGAQVLLQESPHLPTCLLQLPRPSLSSPCAAWIFAPGGPAPLCHLSHRLVQHPAHPGHHRTPRKHGPMARDGEVVTGEYAPMSHSPRLFNKSHFGFKSHPFLQCIFSASHGGRKGMGEGSYFSETK